MNESIGKITDEIDKIEMVLLKLKEKQNRLVFEKLCEKCDSIVDSIEKLYQDDKTKEFKFQFISLLRRLLSVCLVLISYRDYLDNIDENKNIKEENNTRILSYKNIQDKTAA